MKSAAKLGTQMRQGGSIRMPFIGLNMPFVGAPQPTIRPFIGYKKPSVKNHAFSGFTLIELIVTLTIASILMALAAPSFSNFVKNNRLTTQSNDMMADLAFARSEAVKRGLTVTLCKSDDGATCTAGAAWNNGWVIWVDGIPPALPNDTLDAGEVLRVHGPLGADNTLTGTGAIADEIAYDGSGLMVPTPVAAESFSVCDYRGAAYGRLIDISATGRAALAKNAAGHPTPPASC